MEVRTPSLIFKIFLLLFCLSFPACTGSAQEGKIETKEEYKAVWYAYDNFTDYRNQYPENNEKNFRKYYNQVLDNCLDKGMNAIIIHVRPCSDAVYRSEYYPWSKYISGEQGVDPGYDPLAIMVELTHKKGMKIEAWVNPYRIGNTEMSEDNPAKKWIDQKSRNVLQYDGSWYYNPSSPEARDLIVNGIREIAENYSVDGIHMDDYFYPSFSPANVNSFDYEEYEKSGTTMSLKEYRQEQVNILVRDIYSTIKGINPDIRFGISPMGIIGTLESDYQYYVDIIKWLSSDGYVDYIAPQIYWGFNHPTEKFDAVLQDWIKARTNKKIDLYIGIGVYKAGYNVGASSSEKSEWQNDTDILKKQVEYGRNNNADGFIFFDYEDFVNPVNAKAVEQLKSLFHTTYREITKETTKEKEYRKVLIHSDDGNIPYHKIVDAMNAYVEYGDIEIVYSDAIGQAGTEFAKNNNLNAIKADSDLISSCSNGIFICFYDGNESTALLINDAVKEGMEVHVLPLNGPGL